MLVQEIAQSEPPYQLRILLTYVTFANVSASSNNPNFETMELCAYPPTLLAVERVVNPNLSCHLSSTPAAQQETSKAAMQHSASPIKQLSSQQQGWWDGGVVRGEEGEGGPPQPSWCQASS